MGTRLVVSAFVLVSVALLSADRQPSPSVVIVNGRVFTGVAAAPWAEAVAIAGDRISAVGTTAALRAGIGETTRIVDAGGRLVIPGINDAHVHITWMPEATALDGPPAVQHDPTLDEILQRLRAAVGTAPVGGWIFGEIGARVLDDARATRFVLDPIAPGHPVMLVSWTGHGTLFNTAALRRLGVADSEPDPPGGFFVRMPGQATITGLAHEYAEFMVRRRLTTPPDERAQVDAIRRFGQEAVALGITSLQQMATAAPAADTGRHALAAGVPQRFRVIDFPLSGMGEWREPAARRVAGGPRVTVSGTKWVLDGTPVERLMFLREPYADRPATRGRLNFPAAELEAFLARAIAAREQPLVHAVGDAAIDALLDALERTGGERWQALRPRLEHGDMLDASHYARATRVGLVLVQNPSHFMIAGVMAERLGQRAARVTMMKRALSANVPVAFGSDGLLNPYVNIMFAAMNANNPAEAMSREQALVAYTQGAAYAEFEEARKGTLAPGMLADLAVLSQNIFTVPLEALPATTSVLTVVGGEIVHEQ
jgi:predicted amidohydrolase YtcJ